eukprot:54664_1
MASLFDYVIHNRCQAAIILAGTCFILNKMCSDSSTEKNTSTISIPVQPKQKYNKIRTYCDYYISTDLIGSGTFATVKHCIRISDHKAFAVKILDRQRLSTRELLALKDEIRILKSLEFPYIIDMIDCFDNTNQIYLILELCEGGDLFAQMLRQPNRRFNEERSALIAYIIAQTLKYLHEHFVVHRDLKPENVLFTKNGVLKLTDFGMAHYVKLPPALHVMHTCCGTPHYVAPEVLTMEEYTCKIDLWSLGVILYVMLSGYQPFNHKSINVMYDMIVK